MISPNLVETIRYAFPDLGPVEIILREESAEIFRFIQKKGGGTEYFERLDQLGALRSVHKSAHHSRWEYMVLQMYLTQKLKQSSAFGFSTSVHLTEQLEVSSLEELLKSWVLLNNYGHLQDTIEAERVWFELLLQEAKLRQALIGCMPDEVCRSLAETILRDENLYKLHHLITLALIGRLRKKRKKTTTSFDLWIEMIKGLLSGTLDSSEPQEGSTMQRAITAFNALRRVSYVLMDINRSILFLRIDSNNILRSILSTPDVFLYDPESEVNQLLENIEHLLFSQVYANQEACVFKYHYVQGQKTNFQKIISKNGMDLFCKNHKVLATQLHQAKINNFGKYKPSQKAKHLWRLNLLPSFPFERNTCRFFSEQQKMRAKVDTNLDFLVTPTPYSETGSILDVFRIGELDPGRLSIACRTLAEYIIDSYEDWWSIDPELTGSAASTPLQELFAQTLKLFIKPTLQLRFASGTSPVGRHIDIILKKGRRQWFRTFSSSIKEGKFLPDREWELKALRKLLSRQKGGILLVAMSNIQLHTSGGVREVEWDGAFLDLEENTIALHLLEAKTGITRASKKCSSALLDSINKAGINMKLGRVRVTPCTGYSYAKIDLRNIVLNIS